MIGGAPQILDSDEVIEASAPMPQVQTNSSAQADALSALSNLGYTPGDAASALAEMGVDMQDADASALIRAALKKLAPKT